MVDQAMKILLVDDNDLDVVMVQRLMKRMSLDFPITRAANGEEALAILRPADADPVLLPPFIMLLDINMPRMNGFELLDALQSDQVFSQIPVYMLTTSSNEQDKAQARKYDVTDYVVKPITAPQLNEILGLESQPPEQSAVTQTPRLMSSRSGSTEQQIVAADRDQLLLHDLKGPITNAKAFRKEASEALSTLRTMIDSNVQSLDAVQIQDISELLTDDLQPCLDFIYESLTNLETRIHQYEATGN